MRAHGHQRTHTQYPFKQTRVTNEYVIYRSNWHNEGTYYSNDHNRSVYYTRVTSIGTLLIYHPDDDSRGLNNSHVNNERNINENRSDTHAHRTVSELISGYKRYTVFSFSIRYTMTNDFKTGYFYDEDFVSM